MLSSVTKTSCRIQTALGEQEGNFSSAVKIDRKANKVPQTESDLLSTNWFDISVQYDIENVNNTPLRNEFKSLKLSSRESISHGYLIESSFNSNSNMRKNPGPASFNECCSSQRDYAKDSNHLDSFHSFDDNHSNSFPCTENDSSFNGENAQLNTAFDLTSGNSDDDIEVKTARLKKNRKRRTSDILVMSGSVDAITPETNVDNDGPRRSRRIRRRSIDLLEYSRKLDQRALATISSSPVSSEDSTIFASPSEEGCSDTGFGVSHSLLQPKLKEEESQDCLFSSGDANLDWTQDCKASPKSFSSFYIEKRPTEAAVKSIPQAEKNRKPLEKYQTVNFVGVSLRKNPKRQSQESNLEDIYMNKLWRDQLKGETAWQTIYEEDSADEMKLSKKSSLRAIDFDHILNKKRIALRRKRAKRLGWQPISRKRHAELDKKVREHLKDTEEL